MSELMIIMKNQTNIRHSARDMLSAIVAIVGVACIIGSIIVGVKLMNALGASNIVEAGGGQGLGMHTQLLNLAETFKLVSVVTSVLVTIAINQRFRVLRGEGSTIALSLGLISSLLLAVSAVVGLGPLHFAMRNPEQMTFWAHALGLASVATNGLWAGIISITAWRDKILPRWLCFIGGSLAVASIAIVAAPFVGLLVAVLGIIWLSGLAISFARG